MLADGSKVIFSSKIIFDKSQIPCFLLANKIDMLEESEIDAKKAQLDDFVAEKEFAGWFPTSAKENKNIDRAASELIR